MSEARGPCTTGRTGFTDPREYRYHWGAVAEMFPLLWGAFRTLRRTHHLLAAWRHRLECRGVRTRCKLASRRSTSGSGVKSCRGSYRVRLRTAGELKFYLGGCGEDVALVSRQYRKSPGPAGLFLPGGGIPMAFCQLMN